MNCSGLPELLNTLARWAPIAAATFVGIGLFFTGIQIKTTRKNQEITTAKSVFKDYLQLAFANPSYAKPDSAKPENPIVPEQYDLFVSNMLWAMEEIYTTFGTDDAWKATIKSHIAPHLAHINRRNRSMESYNKEFSKFIQSIQST